MTLSTGQILNNRYRIVRKIAQGGFGAIYRAWDTNLNIPCALKENLDTHQAVQEQFIKEASMLASLRHPNLPRVTDYFAIEGMGQYLVMDYIEGQDLQEMLEEKGEAFPLEKVMQWITQVFDALIFLHSQDPPIIHRDIKPANIKITPGSTIDGYEQAVLVDFGIAKVFDPDQKTIMGAQAVTPGFSPPEQYGHGATDVITDIYALGATMYALLTGQTPPESLEIVSQSEGYLIPAHEINPQVPPRLSETIGKAMQVAKEARFNSMAEFKEAVFEETPFFDSFEPMQVGAVEASTGAPVVEPVIVVPPSMAAPVSKDKPSLLRRGPILAFVLILGALLCAGLIGGGKVVYDYYAGLDATKTQLAILLLPTSTRPPEDTTSPSTATATILDTSTPSPSPTEETPPTSEITPILESGATKISDVDGMVMVYIPEGEFTMGANPDDDLAAIAEKPQHAVYLDEFWMDQTEVTNAMYKLCTQDGACSGPAQPISVAREQYFNTQEFADHPVIYVTWDDANDYCTWAGRRLPTEAEWEKAARGTDTRVYPWGNEEINCEKANYWGYDYWDTVDWKAGKQVGCSTGTVPVGSQPEGASPYGVFDLVGNVGEWVADWFSANYYTASPESNPIGPTSGQYRVIRGQLGYYLIQDKRWMIYQSHRWNYNNFYFTSKVTIRAYKTANYNFWDLGFRCASSP